MKEKHTKSSVAKPSFVNKFFPQTINTHSERKTTPTKKKYFPNSDSRKEVLRRMNTGLLSPSTKQKGEGGISVEFYSPRILLIIGRIKS